jgi:hypothetical protein
MPGYHQFVVEFLARPPDAERFRDRLDAELAARNADYQAHRSRGAGLPPPALLVASRGSFQGWMRRRGKLGGQNKVPRVDNTGTLTRELLEYLRKAGLSESAVPPAVSSLTEPIQR